MNLLRVLLAPFARSGRGVRVPEAPVPGFPPEPQDDEAQLRSDTEALLHALYQGPLPCSALALVLVRREEVAQILPPEEKALFARALWAGLADSLASREGERAPVERVLDRWEKRAQVFRRQGSLADFPPEPRERVEKRLEVVLAFARRHHWVDGHPEDGVVELTSQGRHVLERGGFIWKR